MTALTPKPFEIRALHSARDHQGALARIELLMRARRGTPEGDQLEVLSILVEQYERENFPVDPPDPIDAILFRMEQGGLSRKDLEPILGGRSHVSEILSGKRQLTVEMIRQLHRRFGIPLVSLMGPS